jgi:hypothetical protein
MRRPPGRIEPIDVMEPGFASDQILLPIGQVRQILVNCAELVVAHPSDRLPWHFLSELMAVGIGAGAHGGEELVEVPSLDATEVRPERP